MGVGGECLLATVSGTHLPPEIRVPVISCILLQGSIDDVLGDLLGDEMILPEEPVKLASRARDAMAVTQALPSSRARTKFLLEDCAFSTTAGLTGPDAEISDISDADPQALLQTMKDLDDMDADLLGLKKSDLASSKRAAKGSGKEELPSHPKSAGDTIPAKKSPPSPSNFGHQYRKFSFEDLEDPLAGLLSDDEEGTTKKPPRTESKLASEKGTAPVRDQDKEDPWGDEDFTFGAYQPSVGSCEGRQSHRQSVSRFSAEGGADPKGEPASKRSIPVAASPTHPRKGGADWLGLKDEDLFPPSPTREAQRGGEALSTPSAPPPRSQHSAPAGLPTSSPGAKPAPEGAGFPAKAGQPSHQCVASTQGVKQATAGGSSGTAAHKPPAGPTTSGSPVTWNQAALALRVGDPQRGTARGDLSSAEPAACFPSSQETTGPSVPVQSLLPESPARSLVPGTECQRQLLAAQVQLQSGTAGLQADLLQSQARLAELEAQVRKLELERTQHQLLLESLQQRHQADLELLESAHRSHVKMLETSYQQREERLRREHEELSARYLSQCQEAEQARAELTAQHQRRLAAAAQEKDQEMERLRELQRASILEMRKDHEEQLQRLKLLKDREIDAVTSATSHTRSLNGVIEQMEKFSSSLHELSSRVEASHLSTAQERELGLRQRDEQLRALQERLGRQQRDMEEERSRLQEVMGKTEARLTEQSRLLEQERWRVNAEQCKAESTQRALEEQRKVMVQQIAMEREELEKAKSALLEEQKSVMHRCGEERRRLAAEWADFFAQQKLSKERAEREAERALQVDTQREGTLISLAKEQAELKIRASELRTKEEQLAAEREALERERQELRLEKERVSAAALRTRLRAEEVESMSQVASEKFEEGQRALREARQVQQEQQARLQLVQRQQERLRQQERHVHEEHLSLAQQRLRLDRLRQDLPSGPAALFPGTQCPAASCLSATVAPAPTPLGCSRPPAGLGPSHLHARLMLLKHTAEQDRDFLENEQFFLETLKKASYNMTSHSA
ncbi:fas-binding factor 1 [Puma concolor]|uniref:Fas-binding factor 1 n=1 Tax=Puma concolor TaxID=9696 RepID=A0A6P6I6C8_PUMCO|nr:fas-binding factor 1 [Puma concolor]